MGSRSPEAEAQKTLNKYRRPHFTWATWATPLVLLTLIILCIGASVLSQSNGQPSTTPVESHIAIVPQMASVPVTSTNQSRLAIIDVGAGEHPDLFLYTDIPTWTLLLRTDTPNITETWPIFDHEGSQVAYYGISSSTVDLYAWQVNDKLPVVITAQSSKSGVHTKYEIVLAAAPVFSPDSQWVAFPVQSVVSNTVAIAAAKSDGTQVLNVPQFDRSITDFAWVDNATLLLLSPQPNGTVQKMLGHIDPPNIRLEILPSP
jgi:hypothetical protein